MKLVLCRGKNLKNLTLEDEKWQNQVSSSSEFGILSNQILNEFLLTLPYLLKMLIGFSVYIATKL